MPNNIILLTIDCLRADRLGCLGYQRNITPNIDFLAKEGIVFSQAFSNGPSTQFSFPSIFTSCYALTYPPKQFRTVMRIRGSRRASNMAVSLYMPSIYGGTTLAEILRREGFYTIGIHSNPFLTSYYNYDSGFNKFIQLVDPILVKRDSLLRDMAFRSRKYFELLCGKSMFDSADKITRAAFDSINENPRKKFFLWLHFMDAHYPYLAYPRRFLKNTRTYLKRFLNIGDQVKLYEESYESGIKYVDQVIGDFLRYLQRIGIWIDENFVFLTSDHGEELWEHKGIGHGYKLYDELLHVPLIIDGPMIEKKQMVNCQVELLDVSPTICNLLGIELPESFRGKSLFATFHSKEVEGVISEYTKKDESGFSYRDDKWKFILTVRNGAIRRELYDLTKDKKERMNVYEMNKDIATVYERYLSRHLEEEDITRKRRSLVRRIGEIKRKLTSVI